MNDPTPLTPETLDALLSAELDGDLEAAARDLGLSASEARARLTATAGVDARRAALTRARDLLASRPPVEASVEDRLVAAALARDDLATVRARRARRQRQWRALVATGSVAAAIAVVVGIASLQSPSSSNSKASSASATTQVRHPEADKAVDRAEAPNVPSTPVDLGAVTDANQLRPKARQLLRNSTTKGASQLPTSTPAPHGTDEYNGATADATNKSFADAAPACTAARLRDYTVPDRPALIASGTVGGAAVVILIYDGAGSPYANVIRVGDCSLLAKLPLR
jgi:hypothetical protein